MTNLVIVWKQHKFTHREQGILLPMSIGVDQRWGVLDEWVGKKWEAEGEDAIGEVGESKSSMCVGVVGVSGAS